MRALRRFIHATLLTTAITWCPAAPAWAGPPRGEDVETFPVDLCLKAVRPDADRPCVSFVDGAGRGWFIADVAGVHRSLRSLRFKPGQCVRVIGEACVDCMKPMCGSFAGFIFDARLVPYRRGDVNGDGEVNIGDIGAVLDAFGPRPDPPAPCPADLDRDGFVDIDDLAEVMELAGRRVRISVPRSGS